MNPQDARRRQLLLTLPPVLASWGVCLACLVAWWGRLPGRMASQFGTDGLPTAYGPRTTTLGLLLALVVAPSAALVGQVARRRVGPTGTRRSLVAGVVGLTVVMAAMLVRQMTTHLDLVHPEDARNPMTTGLLWTLPGVAVGLLVWWLCPDRSPDLEATTATPPPAPLRPGTRAVWTSRATAPRWLLGLLAAAVILTTLTAVSRQDWALTWVPVLVAAVGAASTSLRVTVDARGLSWRTGLGLPRGHVPLDQVAGAEAVQVGLGDYGGWGFRIGTAGPAVVVRNGAALRVTRTSGRRLTLTVDDAATGAALLQALTTRG